MQRGGRRIHGANLVVVHLANELGTPRFGFAVSRKVGNAVVRNRVKRRLRDVVRRRRSSLGGVDMVVIARPSAAAVGYDVLAAEIDAAVARIRKGTP